AGGCPRSGPGTGWGRGAAPGWGAGPPAVPAAAGASPSSRGTETLPAASASAPPPTRRRNSRRPRPSSGGEPASHSGQATLSSADMTDPPAGKDVVVQTHPPLQTAAAAKSPARL